MPAYIDPNRENMTAALTQIAVFLCPSDQPPIPTWPGATNYLGNQQTWACDLSENFPNTNPAEVPRGIFYYNSSVQVAHVTDGTSNTAYFSEKLRGQGVPNPQHRPLDDGQSDVAGCDVSDLPVNQHPHRPAAHQRARG